jgi:ubiquinone/menaquinone biosynthesis C-methylase UbiE
MTHKGEAYPASGAFLLDSWIRRWIQPPHELIEMLNIEPNGIVVDFGCGPGYYTVELARSAKMVYAVDISPEMLKKAHRKTSKAGLANVLFLQSNGTRLELADDSVDIVLLVTVYHEVGESEATLKEFGRVLKPNGRLVIVEMVKPAFLMGAPVQNPQKLKLEIEAAGFKLKQMEPYKSYGVFFFTKTS